MTKTDLKGSWNGAPYKFAIVVSSFNKTITDSLLEGAKEAFSKMGVDRQNITVAHVPGAFEIPLIAKKLARQKKYHAVVCLGAVIRGETPHFDYVCSQVASGITTVSLEMEIPIIFGVLTVDTTEQALHRSGIKGGHKGEEAAKAAVEMASLLSLL